MSDELSAKIQGTVLTPSSPGYASALKRNSDLSVLPAALVVQPAVYTDIPPVLAYAASHRPPLEVVAKCGGAHSSTWASSDGGIVIDLSSLNRVTLSADRQTVVVQGGAKWGDVYELGSKEGFEVAGTPFWFIGVGGSMLGGAYGNWTAARGLGIDNLVAATVVLADGRIVKTSATEEPDLFWAIRGGGNKFGIIVEFVLKTFPSPGPASVGALIFPASAFHDVLKVYQDFVANSTENEKITMLFSRPPPHFKPVIIIAPFISSASTNTADDILKPFRALNPIVDNITSVPNQFAVSHANDAALAIPARRLTIRGTAYADLWTDMVTEVWTRYCAFTETYPDARSSAVIWEPRGRTQKLTEVGAGETAFPLRVAHHSIAIQGRNMTPEFDAVTQAWAKDTVDFIREANTKHSGRDFGILFTMAQGDEAPEAVFGSNLPRLRKLRAKYDPGKLWAKGVEIEPDFE